MKTKKEYTFDRAEGDIAVCHSREDGHQIEIPAELLTSVGVPEGGIFAADMVEDQILNIEYLAEKTNETRGRARSRLLALFNRRKEEKI